MKQSLALAVFVAFLACAAYDAHAQEEQWLQYRSSREPYRQGVSVSASNANYTGAAPAEDLTPDFVADDAHFGKWETPMGEAGFVWLALDRSSANGPYETLYIDSDCDGSLADEEAVAAYQANQWPHTRPTSSRPASAQEARFGPVKVVFPTDLGPVAVHVNVLWYDYPGRKSLYVSAAGWYEGSVTVGAEEYMCRLVDFNSNGAFNDASMDFSQADQIWIGKGTDLTRSFVGKYILIDGEYYHPTPAVDGANISFAPVENIPLGTLTFPEGVDEIAIGGVNGLLAFQCEGGSVEVPAGRWLIERWSITRKDEKGAVWQMTGQGFSSGDELDVAEGARLAIEVGEPISATLTVSERSGEYSFQEKLAGASGERISLTRNGTQAPAPRLRIKNEDESYNRLYSFAYG